MTNKFDDIIRYLDEWSGEQKLIERSIEYCKIGMKNSADEEAELFPTMNTGADILRGHILSDIQLHFNKQSMVFKHGILSYPYVETVIGLYLVRPNSVYFRDLEPIGTYSLIVKLDGEIVDDYLILDVDLREQG